MTSKRHADTGRYVGQVGRFDNEKKKLTKARLQHTVYETLGKKAARRAAVHVVQHEPESVLSQVWVS
jgi:hypothetical protein